MPDAQTNAASVLERAADVIVERGWCQDAYVGEAGHVCAAGAIVTVVEGKPPDPHLGLPGTSRACSPIMAFLSWVQQRAPQIHDLATWNDTPGRTADEVITALRECAAELRAAS